MKQILYHTVLQTVAKRPQQRPVQNGTSKVKVDGNEAAPYNVVIGNTHPDSTEDIIKEVLLKVSEQAPSDIRLDEPLRINEVECLTKPRTDGRRIWVRTWRVQVPSKFREYMENPDAYPAGWTCRRYFPPRPDRPPVPNLNPLTGQPPCKKPNVEGTSHPLN